MIHQIQTRGSKFPPRVTLPVKSCVGSIYITAPLGLIQRVTWYMYLFKARGNLSLGGVVLYGRRSKLKIFFKLLFIKTYVSYIHFNVDIIMVKVICDLVVPMYDNFLIFFKNKVKWKRNRQHRIRMHANTNKKTTTASS